VRFLANRSFDAQGCKRSFQRNSESDCETSIADGTKNGEQLNHFPPDAARDFVQGFPDVLLLSCGFSTSASIED
jgi:hypothetical protein